MKELELRFSNTYLVAALLLSVTSLVGVAISATLTLTVLAVVVALLGLPHGALDPMVAQQVFPRMRRPVFYLLYLVTMALVLAVWSITPDAALVAFLLIAAFHFGSDLDQETHIATRACYGLAVVCLPSAFHGGSVTLIYRELGAGLAMEIVTVSRWIALAASALLIVDALRSLRNAPRKSAECLLLLLSGCLMPSLLFFSCYFGLLHSPRHLLETAASLGIQTMRQLIAVALPITLITVGLGVCAWLPLRNLPHEQRIEQVIFIGLAVLTVPHMVLEFAAEHLRPPRSSGTPDKLHVAETR